MSQPAGSGRRAVASGAPTSRVLTAGELNRAMLARQLLLERAELTIPDALERIGGIQDQYAPSGYVALRARIASFRREDLTRALEERAVVQATLLRSTIHLVSRADFWPLRIAVDRALRAWWRRTAGPRLLDRDAAAAVVLVREVLARGPRRQPGLRELLVSAGYPREMWSAVSIMLPMVRVPPSGTWDRRRADLHGLAELWLGPPPPLSEAEARALLVRRYLTGFGPAPIADIASWAGIPAADLRPTVERLRPELVTYRDERGRELLDLPDLPLPPADTPAPVRLLPTWEAMLLVHARRTEVLPERFRPILFTSKNPQSMPTFLVDGQVAGSWRHEDGRIRIEPFDPDSLSPAVRRELDTEAERLAAFYNGG